LRRRVRHQGGLAGKYAFRGALKGLSLNSGVSYVSKQAAENPNTGDLFNAAGVYTGNDGRRALQLPSYTLLNFSVHYRFDAERPHGIRQTVSVFGKNLTDRRFIEYLTSQSTASDRRTVYVTYSVGY
jgi:outer membrane receptor protein involved in Fe transport